MSSGGTVPKATMVDLCRFGNREGHEDSVIDASKSLLETQ